MWPLTAINVLSALCVDRQMGCMCVRPLKADNNGVGPSQSADPQNAQSSASHTVDPESVVVTSTGNKPAPPPVAQKKRV